MALPSSQTTIACACIHVCMHVLCGDGWGSKVLFALHINEHCILCLPLGSLMLGLFTCVNLCLISPFPLPLGLHIVAFSCELIFMFGYILLRCDASGA